MSLFVPYEKMWDMPMDPTVLPEEKHVPRWFVWLTIILTFIIQFVAFRTSSTHKERPVAYKG
ncbi:MAG: 1-acyl-sn-glycerol-3-phosphate acyltransferase, partial [Eggerthellaceae bacterium]|nr:1-acyl-sn-glycerol-3-phosphate acyltransferase [Eggerthellaceae bacterium]